jgi:hypothetical protein
VTHFLQLDSIFTVPPTSNSIFKSWVYQCIKPLIGQSPLWKGPHSYTQNCALLVSLASLNPIKLTIQIDHRNSQADKNTFTGWATANSHVCHIIYPNFTL